MKPITLFDCLHHRGPDGFAPAIVRTEDATFYALARIGTQGTTLEVIRGDQLSDALHAGDEPGHDTPAQVLTLPLVWLVSIEWTLTPWSGSRIYDAGSAARDSEGNLR